MLNRFKNAIYGIPNPDDDARLDYDNQEALKSKRVRSALTRSSSFREDLLKDIRETYLRDTETPEGSENITRGRSQIFHRANSSNNNSHSNTIKGLLNDTRHGLKNTRLPKFRYSRPEFLQLKTEDEILVSADHQIRPIILPRDISRLPWNSGYAECINAGKSLRNEDQAACYQDVLIKDWLTLCENNLDVDAVSIENKLPWTYYGIFDGHAGAAVAVAAATQLHTIIGEKLSQVVELLIELEFICQDDDDEQSDKSTTNGDTSTESNSNAAPELVDQLADSIQVDNNLKIENKSDQDQPESQPNGSTLDDIVKASNEGPKTSPSDNESPKSLPNNPNQSPKMISPERNLYNMNDIVRSNVSVDSLVCGALEAAFWEMDAQIAQDKLEYKMPGGCTAIVGLFILGKLYVCNAGDSRAIVYKNGRAIPMSFDFTPTSERERILRLGLQRPEFLGSDFTHLEFVRRPTRRDLGRQMLYRDAYMSGWAMKTITYDDLKFPLVWGEGKRSRVLATIGVTRGFGDHELRAHQGSVPIKPFLTPEPQVRILPLEYDDTLTSEDVLIIGSDGLWDVTGNEDAANIVKASLELFPESEESCSKYRYITAAQDLVIHSRGSRTNTNNVWRTEDDSLASLDDIAVFVIPLKQYKEEYLEWKRLRSQIRLRARENNQSNDRINCKTMNSNDGNQDEPSPVVD